MGEQTTPVTPETTDQSDNAGAMVFLVGAAVLGGVLAYLVLRARGHRIDPMAEANRIIQRAHEKVCEIEQFVGDLRRAWEAVGH